jgi:hypothetical protein
MLYEFLRRIIVKHLNCSLTHGMYYTIIIAVPHRQIL